MHRMKLIFKKYFIPHEGNGYKPHLLRWEVSLVLLSVILGVELLFVGQVFVIRNTSWLADILESVLVDQTNVERQEAGLYGLQVNELLQKAAQLKQRIWLKRDILPIPLPMAKPWYWLEQAGYVFCSCRENLAVKLRGFGGCDRSLDEFSQT